MVMANLHSTVAPRDNFGCVAFTKLLQITVAQETERGHNANYPVTKGVVEYEQFGSVSTVSCFVLK